MRNVRWDNYKALLGLLMVYGHTFRAVNAQFPAMGGVFVFIYVFHMPAFLFVSGMFSKRAAAQNDSRRVVSLFLQYLLVKFVLLGVNALLNGEVKFTNLLSEGGVAWFALSTMECLLLTMLLKHVQPAYVFTVGIVLGCLVGYCADIGTFLSLSRTIVYFPYFYLGYCLDAARLGEIADRKWVKALSAAFLLVLLIVSVANADFVYTYYEFIKAKASYSAYTDVLLYPVLGGVYRLILYAVGFAATFACLFLVPGRKIPVVSGVGSRTLSLYVFHYVLVSLAGKNGWLKGLALSTCSSAPQVALFYLIVSAIIVLISSCPPLEWLARKITAVPLRKPQASVKAAAVPAQNSKFPAEAAPVSGQKPGVRADGADVPAREQQSREEGES